MDAGLDNTIAAAIAQIAALEWREPPEVGRGDLEGAVAFGAYDGLPPEIALLEDGRKAKLLKPLSYTSASGLEWPVPSGSLLDGASIPRAFWTLIGGPFEGKYRNASIVHDYYCDHHVRAWRDTHRMFHEAMLCSGVSSARAKIMFYAVYRFGPRWPDPLEAVAQVDDLPETLTASNAPSLARDAEAIFLNDLTLDEIETLADARRAPVLEGHLEGASTQDLSRTLCIVGGTGTKEDLEAIVASAVLLPDYVLSRFDRIRLRIIACRDSVTDFETSLRGVIPRGWEKTGKTWDDVPGAYLPNRRRVVVATIASDGIRAIPSKGHGTHGSSDLLVHEALHGFEFAGGHADLSDPAFLEARQADYDSLGSYEQQNGDAGLQETFAESGAWYFSDPVEMAKNWPNLRAFWDRKAGGEELESVLEGTWLDPEAIGTAELQADGSLALDLRAEGPGGMIGHALFLIDPADPAYADLTTHAFGSDLEGAERGQVLFRP